MIHARATPAGSSSGAACTKPLPVEDYGMKRKLEIDDENHPLECPNEHCGPDGAQDDDQIAISNIDGYECLNCGCWFEAIDGDVEWAYESPPVPLP